MFFEIARSIRVFDGRETLDSSTYLGVAVSAAATAVRVEECRIALTGTHR